MKNNLKRIACSLLAVLMSLTMSTAVFAQAPDASRANAASHLSYLDRVAPAENGAQSPDNGDTPLTDQPAGTKPTVTTTLQNGATVKGSIKTFDLVATNEDGSKISASNIVVTLNGSPINASWDDSVKTSYKLSLAVGANAVEITATGSNSVTATCKYTLNHTAVNTGDVIGKVSFCVEAFTISAGYIVEPEQVEIHEGERASQVLDRVLKENGLTYKKTGSLTSGFYLSEVKDGTKKMNIKEPAMPDVLAPNIKGFHVDSSFDGTSLGEFDFTSLSGWMYCVNGNFPNVGFADSYPEDNAVVRVQFTLALGKDIGGGYATGGTKTSYYPIASKDSLTALVAQINSSSNKQQLLADISIKKAYASAITTLENLSPGQSSVDAAYAALSSAVAAYKPGGNGNGNSGGVTPTDRTISGTPSIDGKGATARISSDFGDTASIANVKINLDKIVVALPSAVIKGAFGSNPASTLSLSQAESAVETKEAVDKAAFAASLTSIGALDINLTKMKSDGSSEAIHSLDGSANITVKLSDEQLAKITDASKAHLYYYDPEAGKLTDMNAVFDLAAKTVSFATTHFSTFVIATDGVEVNPGVSYQAHVRNIGWQDPVENGVLAGTTGNRLRVEALKINLTGKLPAGASITYWVHVQNIGWMAPSSDGQLAGTTGKSLQVEGLKMTIHGLTGYRVKYRVHVQNKSWMDWKTTNNGTRVEDAALAGTTGQSLRIEAIEVIVEKDS